MNRLLDGFNGKFTSSKYAELAKCSQATALHDIVSFDTTVSGATRVTAGV